MLYMLWDASALAKRYAPEIGTTTVNTLFTHVPLAQMRMVVLGCTETFAILVRKRNRNDISATAYTAAVSALQNEVIYNLDFGVLPMEADAVLASVALIARHNINSIDAAILSTFMRHTETLVQSGAVSLLIASDQRLVRAANAEGLNTLNPELVNAADVPAFLAAL